jgi:DNA-binding NtrC family response regulator
MNQSRTALIVDDEAPLLRLLVRVLERAGFVTWPAQDGVEALRVFREHADEIDLVVLDVIHPPGAGAVDLLPALLAESPDLDVILTSGDVLPESLEKRLASVGGQFLRKPFAPRALIAMLESASGQPAAEVSNSTKPKTRRRVAQADSGVT